MLQRKTNVLLQRRITCCKTTQLDAHAHQSFSEADGYTPQLRHRIVPDAVATDTHWRRLIEHTEGSSTDCEPKRAGAQATRLGPRRLCDAMRFDAQRAKCRIEPSREVDVLVYLLHLLGTCGT